MYVGQTIHFEVRKKTHLNSLRKGKHHSIKLQRAWDKYGEENFEFICKEVEINRIEDLLLLEQKEIREHDSYFNGYNMTIGGEGIIRKNFTLERYCFIYFGNTVFEGMMRETANFLNVDKSVISDITKGITYPEYYELIPQISEEEKQIYLKNFVQTFGIDVNNPPKILNKQKVDYQKLAFCMCIMDYYENVGKSLERILGYSKGTMSALKTRKHYQKALEIYDSFSNKKKKEYADKYYKEWKILEEEKQTKNSTTVGLTQEDYNLAYAMREEGYGYTCVALYLGIKPSTVKDWFSGKSRAKNLEVYKCLSNEEKNKYHNKIPHIELQKLENDRERLLRQRNSNRPF